MTNESNDWGGGTQSSKHSDSFIQSVLIIFAGLGLFVFTRRGIDFTKIILSTLYFVWIASVLMIAAHLFRQLWPEVREGQRRLPPRCAQPKPKHDGSTRRSLCSSCGNWNDHFPSCSICALARWARRLIVHRLFHPCRDNQRHTVRFHLLPWCPARLSNRAAHALLQLGPAASALIICSCVCLSALDWRCGTDQNQSLATRCTLRRLSRPYGAAHKVGALRRFQPSPSSCSVHGQAHSA